MALYSKTLKKSKEMFLNFLRFALFFFENVYESIQSLFKGAHLLPADFFCPFFFNFLKDFWCRLIYASPMALKRTMLARRSCGLGTRSR